MNMRRFYLSSLIVFIFVFLFEWLCHTVFLHQLYMDTAMIWRPHDEMETYLGYTLFGQFLLAVIFCYFYTQLPQFKDIGGGFQYGFWIGLLMSLPAALMSYSILPIPGMLAIWWAIMGIVQTCIMGMLCGLLYKHQP